MRIRLPFFRRREAPPPAPPPFGKVDILHSLADRLGYRNFLEISTGTTGNYYGDVDRGRFDSCRRLIYNVPADYEDGAGIDHRGDGFETGAALAEIAASGIPVDLMLVDPFHTYDISYRDIADAFALLSEGGAIVVHDCLPPNEAIANPEFIPQGWCGVTYKAFVDFALAHSDLAYLTVDTDFGCGILWKCGPGLPNRLSEAWSALGSDYGATFRFLRQHQRELLHLVSVDDFLAATLPGQQVRA